MTDAEGGSPAPTSGLGARITSVLVCIVLRLVGVNTPLRTVRARRKIQSIDEPPADGSWIPERSEFVFNLGLASQEHTDDKTKHLLALASSVAAFLIVFAPRPQQTWPSYVAVGALIVCVSLCVFLLGVRPQTQPTPEPRTADPDGSVWARDLLRSAIANQQHHRFLVDLYAGARRWFFLALVFLGIILLLPQQDVQDPVSASVQDLTAAMESQLGALREDIRVLGDAINARAPGPEEGAVDSTEGSGTPP